ncbi:MAG: hypothetical protein KGJ43_02485, partial [Acidobacteriota bacterium]|nr:hypothetical protein [Acidobacteriota bacterium]
DQTCVLRAVPHGDGTDYPPNSPSRFSGPTLSIGQRYDVPITGGPNAGRLRNHYLYAAQSLGAFDYSSLGDCALTDSYLYNPITYADGPLSRLFACNAFLWWENGRQQSGFAGPTRSDVRVDGVDAFLPASIPSLFTGAEDLAGFPALTYRVSRDPATGNVAMEEGEPLVRCAPGGAFPPTAESCTSLVPTGVSAYLHISQGSSGRLSSVTQYFESTDGRAHQLDLLEENEFFTPSEDGRLEFPWLAGGFAPYLTPGQVLGSPPAGPSTFYVKASAAEGPQGAVTMASAPSAETVAGTTANGTGASRIQLAYQRTVPAGQYVALGFTYADGFALPEAEAAAAAAQAAYVPRVAIAAPATGTTSATSPVTVSGTASDPSGLASLIVAGQSVSVGAGGAWSAAVPLVAAGNTITATATNIFGNSAQAQVQVVYAPVPPQGTLRIVGRAALTAAGAAFTVRCAGSATARCRGTAALSSVPRVRSRAALAFGARSLALSGGRSARVEVALNGRALRLLRRAGRLRVRLVVRAQVRAGVPPAGGAGSRGGTGTGRVLLRRRFLARALRTGSIARAIAGLIRRVRHIRARVRCPIVAVRVRGGRFTCTASGHTGAGRRRRRFSTPFAVRETDGRGNVVFHS